MRVLRKSLKKWGSRPIRSGFATPQAFSPHMETEIEVSIDEGLTLPFSVRTHYTLIQRDMHGQRWT